jgi:hypothetical protein
MIVPNAGAAGEVGRDHSHVGFLDQHIGKKEAPAVRLTARDLATALCGDPAALPELLAGRRRQ